MRTVKEVSEMTGISVRTLHYYDEIGLFKPTDLSEAGYRLYDDKALEALQQILFFREFDLPLKEIKAVMENPALDRNQILKSQRMMLELKKERLERLIGSIDDILKGENKMDFKVFDKTDLEEMCRAITASLSPGQREKLIEKFGGMEQFEKHFMEEASSPQAQKSFAKIVEWHGSKQAALDTVKNPLGREVVAAYSKRLSKILGKLAAKKGTDVNSWEVKELVGEYDFVAKQLYRMNDMTVMMLDMAREYQTNPELKKGQDKVTGPGTSEYIGQAMEAFYGRKED